MYRSRNYHRSYSRSTSYGSRRRSHSTGVWVVYKDGKHVGYVRSSNESYALSDAQAKYGFGDIRVSEIEE